MPGMREINPSVIAEYRATGGKLSGPMAGLPVLLLTTTGRRSGKSHVTPLGFATDGDRLIVAAANGGAASDPHWFRNLVTAPEVVVELGAERFNATAVVVAGHDRNRLFEQLASALPGMAEYPQTSGRTIPVIALTREA